MSGMMADLRSWFRPSASELAWSFVLPASFALVVYWFSSVDFYHRHFFDHGSIVLANSLARILFLFVLCWLIYAPGAALSHLLLRGVDRAAVTSPERAVMGFGIGIGLWHVFMLILGHAGLYYRSVIVGITAFVILASSAHFGRVAQSVVRRLSRRDGGASAGYTTLDKISVILIVAAAAWLLVARGLYPGGGGDYYTHYFYYNLEVLKQHGLAPNDVWYHFFYSQGYGLHFLGMLLTDPEAPALATFGCIAFGAAAMAALVHRIAPNTLWPACITVLYLMAYLAPLSPGGEFQKGHEQMAALIVIALTGLCMARGPAGRAWLVMATSCCVAVATIAQPFGIIMGLYFLVLALWCLATGRFSAMWRIVFAGATVGGTVLAIFGISYLKTGLFNDQGLDFMLRIADIDRLDKWGVLPQIAIAAWIRDNYADGQGSPGFNDYALLLRNFMRLEQVAAFLVVAVALLRCLLSQHVLQGQRSKAETSKHQPGALGAPDGPESILGIVGGFIAMTAVLSLVVGPSQSTSFERASSFFFPLLMLLLMATCQWASARIDREWIRRSFSWQQPAVLLAGTVILWSSTHDWPSRMVRVSQNGMSLLLGHYSLADAFTRLEDGKLPFGGIHPDALAAAQRLEPGTRIWSTTVDAYCMVPGCWIESVVSFKTSDKLDEILTAPPLRAMQLLQEAGLNYFLIIEGAFLLDVLPYSKLFSPDTIGDYLGIKWTNGTAFLLTWRGPDTTPLTLEFLAMYRKELQASASHPWFKFGDFVPYLSKSLQMLRSKRWGEPASFPWRAPPADAADGTVDIIEASYGHNCRYERSKMPGSSNTYRRGNLTKVLGNACRGATSCSYTIDLNRIRDPVNGCGKDVLVTYKCHVDETPRHLRIPPQSEMKIDLACQ